MSRTYIVMGSFYNTRALPPAFPDDLGDHCVLVNQQHTAKPSGFSYVYNRLVRAALDDPKCEFIWLLGDDVDLSYATYKDTHKFMQSKPKCAAAFPIESWEKDDGWYTLMPHTAEERRIWDAFGDPIHQLFPGFACVVTRREAWESVGFLDEDLGIGYCEDLDWGIRCWLKGWEIWNYRQAAYQHRRGETYNRFILEGKMDKKEPYRAADRVKQKWPFLWEKDVDALEVVKGMVKK